MFQINIRNNRLDNREKKRQLHMLYKIKIIRKYINTNQEKPGEAILILEKVKLKVKSIAGHKEGPFVMITISIH